MSRFVLSKPILTESIQRSPPRAKKPAARAIPDEDDEIESVPDEEVQEDNDSDSGSSGEVQVVQPARPVARRITNEESFWNYVEKLNWRDRSEDANFNLLRKKQDYQNLSIPDQETFADFLTHVVIAMDTVLAAANVYGTLTDVNERKAICSHIVGKGSVFYAMTLEDPWFAAYLVPESPDRKEYYDMMELVRI